MGARYSKEAIDYCFELYLHYNGGHLDLIEKEMRKKWPGWSRNNLHDRGKGADKRDGWIELYGWKNALRLKAATSAEGAATSAELLFLEIEKVRRRLAQDVAVQGTKAEKDLIYQYRDFCKLSIDALARLEAARDNLAGFAKFWDQLLMWLPQISEKAARELLKVAEEVIDRAKVEYASSDSKE